MSEIRETYYRTNEAAKLLKVSVRTIVRWINDGDIKATKLNPLKDNSPFLVSQSEVTRFLKLQEQGEG